MPGKRHARAEILSILAQKTDHLSVSKLCKKYNISEQTYYRWKAKYGDSVEYMPDPVSEVDQRIQRLEEENRRLKTLLGEFVLERSYAGISELNRLDSD